MSPEHAPGLPQVQPAWGREQGLAGQGFPSFHAWLWPPGGGGSSVPGAVLGTGRGRLPLEGPRALCLEGKCPPKVSGEG